MNIRAAILATVFASLAVSAYAAPPMTVTGPDGKQAAVKAASTPPATTDPALVTGIADGNNVAEGKTTDTACTNSSSTCTLIALLKAMLVQAQSTAPVAVFPSTASPTTGTTAAMTGTTSTQLLAAPGSSLHNYVTTIWCVNSHATVGTFVSVQDGSGGTVFGTLAANSVFGGNVVSLPMPWRQPTANTALYVADVTTGANVICTAVGYTAP